MNKQYTFSEELFSDLHKDAFGFRPNSAFWEWLNVATDDEKQAEWDGLVESMRRREELRIEEEKRSIEEFEAAVASTISAGAKDRATAIQWLKDAEGDMYVRDEEYFEWSQGIPYGYIKKTAGV